MKASQREMYIIIADRCFHFIKAYEASDFDCKPIEQCYLPFETNYQKVLKLVMMLI